MTAGLWALADRPPPPLVPGQLAVPDGPAIGSVCTGYGGLDMAVRQVLGGHLAWVADPDPGAAAILTHHHPDVPNLGDITATDWATVPPVDIVCGGYPCQPFSTAGRRRGTADERHIWPYIATALRVLRPRLAILENVAGHLRLGFDTVLADLAGLGFDAEWCTLRASEVGAPHRRERLFVLAWPADTAGPRLPGTWVRGLPAKRRGATQDADRAARGQRRLPAPGQAEGGRARADADRRGGMAAADAEGERRGEGRPEPAGVERGLRAAGGGRAPVADADRDGREGQQRRGPGMGPRPDPDGRGQDRWGRYAPAIARWEAATGRSAPWATGPRGRLNPAFVEWLMGLPAGHVTGVPGLSRTQQLHALGNGVVPQQGAAALRLLLARTPVTT